MRAVIKNSYENTMGNLIWMPPYVYPESELKSAIDKMSKLGYWISCFPEGDGLCFKHETKEESEVFLDFKVNFPWMTIKEYKQEESFDFQKDILNFQLVIMPISRLKVEDIIHAGKFSIYPSQTFPLNKLNIQNSRNSLRNHITELTEASILTYEYHPIIVFTTDTINYNSYNQLDPTQDEFLIKKLSQEADPIMDLIKYYNGEYFRPEFMVANVGLWDEKYSTSLVHFPQQNIAHLQAREVEVKTYIKSLGIELIHIDKIELNPMLLYDLGETGNIAKHALRLNSNILGTDDLTMKFSLIMTLFEYLASPYDYEKFQKVKGKIGVHIARSKKAYNDLMQRFEELTAGLKKNDGTKNMELGLRTSIIHLGKRLEDIITKKDEQRDLFNELQHYVKMVIDDMISKSDLSWNDFELYRNNLKAKMKI